jgi:YesN/AraC family two-component response regulator
MAAISTEKTPLSILVVEDEAITLEYLVTTLARKYPHVTLLRALNGRTGLELFKAHTPDIVITDVNMPDMGGVQMVERIRAIRPDTRFIIITGYAGDPLPEASAENGFEFDHYVEKPVVIEELFDAIDQCIGR